ncbi:MAG: DUF4388 domain-containing protein, partial [Myxococcales bacterium]
QVSRDGLSFAFPGRFPDVRDAFPRELWGDSTEPLPDDDLPPGPAEARRAAPPVVGAPGAPPRVVPAGPPPTMTPPPASPRPVPPPAAPAASAPPAAGQSLAEAGALQAWYDIAAEGRTGRLTLRTPRASWDIFFRRGTPEAVRSTRPEDDFGEFAVARGLLAPEQLADARAMLAGFGGELVNALFGMRLLNPADAAQSIAQHAVSLLTPALSQEEGSWSFDASATAPATAMPLGDRWKLAGDVVRSWSEAEVRRRLGPRIDSPVMRSGGKVELADLKLTAQEARVATFFDGVRSLAQLVAAMPAEAEVILRTALLLSSFELVSFAGVRLPTPPPRSPAPPQGAAAAAPPPAAARAPSPTPVPSARPAGPPPTVAPAAAPPRVAQTAPA